MRCRYAQIPFILLLTQSWSCKTTKDKVGPEDKVPTNAGDLSTDRPTNPDPKDEWVPNIRPAETMPEMTVIKDPDEATPANSLVLGRELNKSEAIQSNDGRFQLLFQEDANLVLYYKKKPLWASGTHGSEGHRTLFGNDGNLLVLDAANKVIWSSSTAGKNAKLARVNNDGSFVIYAADNKIVWSSGSCCYPPFKPSSEKPSVAGKWSEKISWPIIPLHAVMLPTGKVFTFGTDEKGEQKAYVYDVWDPSKGTGSHSHQTLPNNQNTDTFCSSPIVAAASGNVVIPGGDTRNPANRGIKDTLILDSKSQTMSRGPYLANARWYATGTSLTNGEILVVGGTNENGAVVTVPEIYDPKSNSWRSLMGAANGDVINGDEGKWWYPRQWVAPNGKIFGMTGEAMYWLTTSGDGSLQRIGKLPDKSRSYISAAVMYEPGKILQVGGSVRGNIGSRASDGAITVDINSNDPEVAIQNPMAYERAWVSATVLPNGEVLASGGSAFENQLQDPGYTPELWSPETKSFRPMNATTIARLYHSTSLLLQDGSVLIGGGGAPGPLTNLNIEIFYPPYLFDANNNFAHRPVISKAPGVLKNGSTAEVEISGGAIKKVSLVKLGAVTHSNDMEQRLIPLSFTPTGSKLLVQVPQNSNIAPPGYYHLFVLNEAGVHLRSRR